MKLRMLIGMEGPAVTRCPGDLVEVGDEEAARLVAAGFAETVDTDAPSRQPRREKAVSSAAPETTQA